MHVALLTEQNAKSYRSLMLQAYELDADAFTSTPEERAAEPLSWWVRRIGGPRAERAAFGAFNGNELVGAVALEFSRKPKTRHRALLIGMFVLPRFRGAGIGRALVEAAIDFALAREGVRTIILTVTEGNAPAIALYQSVGFERIGIEPMAIHTPAGYKAKVYMWQQIRLLQDAKRPMV